MTETKTHHGSCHCGAVRYKVTVALDGVMSCNCSICQKRGSLLAFVPGDAFKLEQGGDALTEYRFNKHVIHHLFCKTCGILSFARGKSRDGAEMVAINVRCLDDVDIAALSVTHFDGRSM